MAVHLAHFILSQAVVCAHVAIFALLGVHEQKYQLRGVVREETVRPTLHLLAVFVPFKVKERMEKRKLMENESN